MFFRSILATAALVGGVVAQRPANTSICDYYTTALLKDNTAANQYTLLTLLVNTVVIGNYTQPNMNAVPGILAPGMFNGKNVNLLPYFNGALASSNRGDKATAVNFLDGGGADPLKKNMPANDQTSNQYFLLTHLYSFFGGAVGCSTYGMPGFSAYSGEGSMYKVHKFMALGPNEVGYFIQQVGLAAQSFGVAQEDVTAVGTLLTSVFDVKCAPLTPVIPANGPQLQSICTADDCDQSPNANCSAYDTFPGQPANATSSGNGGMNGGGSGTGSATGTAPGSKPSGAAVAWGAQDKIAPVALAIGLSIVAAAL